MNDPSSDLMAGLMPHFLQIKLDLTTALLGMVGVFLILVCADKLLGALRTMQREEKLQQRAHDSERVLEIRREMRAKRLGFSGSSPAPSRKRLSTLVDEWGADAMGGGENK
jgi:hypothetical protein